MTSAMERYLARIHQRHPTDPNRVDRADVLYLYGADEKNIPHYNWWSRWPRSCGNKQDVCGACMHHEKNEYHSMIYWF